MSFDTIGIWTKSEIDATTPPSQYPIQVGTQYVSLQVNNYSPYYLSLQATATGQPFATIKPWTITPVNFGSVGTIYISVNSTLAKRETGNTSLIEGEQVFVVLSTYQDNSQVTELDPTVAANILNAVINAAIQGSVDAVIQSGQVDANISNASIDTNSTILNEVINGQTFVSLGSVDLQNLTIPPTSNSPTQNQKSNNNVYASAIYIVGNSTTYTDWDIVLGNLVNWNVPYDYYSGLSLTKIHDNGVTKVYVVYTDYPYLLSGLTYALYNSSSSSFTDSFNIEFYAITATDVITNSSSNPALNQASIGEFDTIYYWNESVVAGSGNLTTTVVDASVGGYIKQVTQTSFTPQQANTSDLYQGVGGISVQNGGNEIFNGMVGYCASAVVNGTQTYTDPYNPSNVTTNFSSGVANQGVTLVLTDAGSSASGTLQSVGFVIIGQGNAPQVPKTIQ